MSVIDSGCLQNRNLFDLIAVVSEQQNLAYKNMIRDQISELYENGMVHIVCVQHFLGATESVGKHMLEACNNNLEMAVTMFLDGGGIAEEPSTSSSSAASSSRAPPTE